MIPKESFTLLSHPLSLLFSSLLLLLLFLFSSISHPSKHLTQPKPKKTRKKTKHSAIINPLKWLPIIIANTQFQKCFLVSSHAPQKNKTKTKTQNQKKRVAFWVWCFFPEFQQFCLFLCCHFGAVSVVAPLYCSYSSCKRAGGGEQPSFALLVFGFLL